MASATQIKAPESNLDQLCINSIRVLAIDAVQKANSGHPGMPMGMAPIAYLLFTRFMRHNPRIRIGTAVIVSCCLPDMARCCCTRRSI